MFIDEDKKMWFGTNWGASRFDGKTWKSFDQRKELPAEWVRAIAQDKEGCLWFGTYPPTQGRGGIGRARKRGGRDSIENRIAHKPLSGIKKQIESSGN
jgi:ligand-binding sensor domain-containing protein